MRKQIIKTTSPTDRASDSRAVDIDSIATVMVSSELPDHPVENAFDGQKGPSSTRWISEPGREQELTLAFDLPQTIRKVGLESEETDESRTQEIHLSVSHDNGKTYRELLRQEFNFSPDGATFEREEWTINSGAVTHLRLRIKPDKSGVPHRTSITSLWLS